MAETQQENPEYSDDIIEIDYEHDPDFKPGHDPLPEPIKADEVNGQPGSDDLPPKYDDVVSGNDAFQYPPVNFCDIYPKCISPGQESQHPEFEKFDAVINAANIWLKENPWLKVISCETLDRRCSMRGDVDTTTSFRHEPSNGEQSFVRILRLWVTKQSNGDSNPQQLGYCNLTPTPRTEKEDVEVDNALADTVVFHPGMMKMGHAMLGGVHGMSVGMKLAPLKLQRYQTLKQVVATFNRRLENYPLPGKIISVESVDFKKGESWDRELVDLDSCYWHMRNMTPKHFLTCLRVYYIVGESIHDQIDVTSFSPVKQENRQGQSRARQYEGFNSLLGKTSEWINSQNCQGLLNLNSSLISYTSEETIGALKDGIDTETTCTTEIPTSEKRFMRVIRVFSSKSRKNDVSDALVTCKLFIPTQLHKRKYETIQDMVQRASKWISAAGLQDRILGAETTEFPLNSLETPALKIDETAIKIYRTRGNYWITCFRIFIRGEYKEPANEETLVQVKHSSCAIS